MRHRVVGTPPGLVQIKPVLPETSKVENAEIGTARRDRDFPGPGEFLLFGRGDPESGEGQAFFCVLIVRGWFTEVVNTSPNELAKNERVLVQRGELRIGHSSPWRRVPVVRTDLEIRLTPVLIVRDREKVFAPRTYARSGFTAEDGLLGLGRVKLRVFSRVVVITQHTQRLAETIVAGLKFRRTQR